MLCHVMSCCHSGWLWSIISQYSGIDIDECNDMTRPLLSISICSIATLIFITPLRYRQASLQIYNALMIFLVFTVCTLIGELSGLHLIASPYSCHVMSYHSYIGNDRFCHFTSNFNTFCRVINMWRSIGDHVNI
jgi:hypothetical protein